MAGFLVYRGKQKVWGGYMVGMEIWLAPVLEYYFEKLSGEKQKMEGVTCA